MLKNKLYIAVFLVTILVISVAGYLWRYHFLSINYLTAKAEDGCIKTSNNDALEAKKCICFLRSMLVVVPESESRSFIIKVLNKDEIGVRRILASNIGFMNILMASDFGKKCDYSRIRFHNGLVKTYYENGNINQEQLWHNDKLVRLVSYYDNGNKKEEINTCDIDIHGNIVKCGYAKIYYKNGQLKEDTYYKNGKIDGKFKSFYEDGILEFKSDYTLGKLNEEKHYYTNGKLNYVLDLEKGVAKYYYKNGDIEKEGNIKNGHIEETWKIYCNNIVQTEIDFVHGVANGAKKLYYHSGKVRSVMHVEDNMLNGKFERYYENGNLEYEGNYRHNKLEGITKQYYENGNLKSVSEYSNGKKKQETIYYDINGKTIIPDGLYKWYYDNGDIQCEASYIKGKREGVAKSYYKNGNVCSEEIYVKDELSKSNRYYENGKIEAIINYKNGILDGKQTRYDCYGNTINTK